MRPPSPAVFRRTLLDRLGFSGAYSQQVRVVVRELERRPGRALITSARHQRRDRDPDRRHLVGRCHRTSWYDRSSRCATARDVTVALRRSGGTGQFSTRCPDCQGSCKPRARAMHRSNFAMAPAAMRENVVGIDLDSTASCTR